jgi:hypothetical protein
VGLELAHVQGVLQLYCRALTGTPVDVLGALALVHKGLGWVDDTAASTDGTRIFLPPRVERFPIWQDNFAWLKVVATHQVAHLEFGSFAFSFDTPSTLFSDRRSLHETATRQRWEAQGQQQRLIPPCLTAMERFLGLFANRRLALDIFTVLEDCRLDARIAAVYPGMRSALRRAQAAALASRPRIEALPVQETLVELLLRMSLEGFTELSVPQDDEEVALLLACVLHRLRTVGATVEDTAEATLRAYTLISPMANVRQAAERWRTAAFDAPGDFSEAAYETLLRQWSATRLAGDAPGAGQTYRRLPPVDYRGDFKPALVQLLAQLQRGQHRRDDGSELSREVLEQALQAGVEVVWDEEYDGPNTGIPLLVRNLLQEVGVPLLPAGGGSRQANDAQGGPLEAHEVRTYVYDEWDCCDVAYKPRWCLVKETVLAEGELTFYDATLRQYRALLTALTRQFERLLPTRVRKVCRLVDGEDLDLNAALEAWADLRMHVPPEEKIYWRRDHVQRDVAVAFLLDMSASTAEPLDMGDPDAKRLIDLAKESLVLLIQALQVVGDTYGIYGFSGYGRDNVEFYVIKDLEERFGDRIKRRLDTITPAHATRMGAAIRHAIAKLESRDAATRLLLLLSDGRPQDRDYPRNGIDKDYAVHDTHIALLEAKRKRITPFCLTVDQAGHDYMQAMCGDIGYEVLESIASLPTRLPTLYRTLTF